MERAAFGPENLQLGLGRPADGGTDAEMRRWPTVSPGSRALMSSRGRQWLTRSPPCHPNPNARSRIAQIAPLAESVPPRLYGGTERVVAHLTDALVAAGHDVTLFASGDARTDGAARADARAGDPARPGAAQVRRRRRISRCCTTVRRRAREFDVLHFHIDLLHFPLFERIAARTLTTLHGRLDLADLPAVYRRWHAVSADLDLRQPAPAAAARELARAPSITACRATCSTSAPRHRGYLAFVGRISPEKRPDRAIEIAAPCGRATAHRREGRRRGHDLFPRGHRAAAARPATSSSWARSTTRRRTSSWAARRRCSSRSTGRSRSAS